MQMRKLIHLELCIAFLLIASDGTAICQTRAAKPKPPATPSTPAVVELVTGQRVEGFLQQITASGVVFEVGGQVVTFELSKVRAVYFGQAPQPCASAEAKKPLWDEALEALEAVHSAVGVGVNYSRYTQRVQDSKIIVDRYLRQDSGDPEDLRLAISKAMGLYGLAAAAWNARIVDYPDLDLATDPRCNDCPELVKLVESSLSKLHFDPSKGTLYEFDLAMSKIHIIANDGIELIWHCASQKIAEAEQLAKGKR